MDHINYQYHKFSGCILFPYRLIFLFINTIIIILLSFLANILNHKYIFNKLILIFNKILISVLGFNLHIDGEYSPDTSLIISNHINMFDHFIIVSVCNCLNAFVVSDKFNFYPFNILTNNLNCIYVTKKGGVTNKIKNHIN